MNTLNIHPIFVHFPIALLTLYTMLEMCRLPLITRQAWWLSSKRLLLFTGILGAGTSILTGEWAQEAYKNTTTMKVVELHSTFAYATMAVYGLLTLLYIVHWIQQSTVRNRLFQHAQIMWRLIDRIVFALYRAPVCILGAILGLILMTITGALGGAITYGPDVDPIVGFVYHLFFP